MQGSSAEKPWAKIQIHPITQKSYDSKVWFCNAEFPIIFSPNTIAEAHGPIHHAPPQANISAPPILQLYNTTKQTKIPGSLLGPNVIAPTHWLRSNAGGRNVMPSRIMVDARPHSRKNRGRKFKFPQSRNKVMTTWYDSSALSLQNVQPRYDSCGPWPDPPSPLQAKISAPMQLYLVVK